MKIAICDDDARCLGQAVDTADAYVREHSEIKITVSSFSHPEDLLEEAEKIGGFDIYVLDIVMPFMNGIELGKKLRDSGYDGKIIYLTSSEEYALDAFKVKAFNYIIKPVDKETFFKTMDEAISLIYEKKDKSLLVKTKARSVKLTYDSITYAELAKRAVIYHTVGGKAVETMSLRMGFAEAVADLLADSRFALCGVGMAVNLDHVTEIESEAVVFANSERAFLGKKACRELRGVWTDYLFRGEGSL